MCKACGDINHIAFFDFKAEYKGINKLIDKIYKKKLKSGDVDKGLYLSTANKLFEGVEKGYDKKLIDIDYKTPDYKRLAFMRENIFVFSAFKTYQTLRAVSDLLAEDLSKEEFKKQAIAKFDEYDGRYLDAEYNNAILSATSARQWGDIVDAKDELPYLKYSTVGDANVRPEHARLEGVTLPVDDPFWNIYMPPNDWGCRCDVYQVAEAKVTPKEEIDFIEIKPMFRNNVGKSGIVFPETHPYFNVAKKDEKAAKNLFGLEIPQISQPQQSKPQPSKRQVLIQQYQSDKDLKQEYVGKNGVVFIHKNADPNDFENNLKAAKVLADNGYVVVINKHQKRGIKEGKNPEYLIDGEYSDMKTPAKLESIKSSFANAEKQKLKEFVCFLELNHSKKQIIEGIQLGFYHNKSIESVIFIKNKKVLRITKNQWIDRSFIAELDKIL